MTLLRSLLLVLALSACSAPAPVAPTPPPPAETAVDAAPPTQPTPDAGVPEKPALESPVLASLERTACFGFCPVYTVTVHADGSVDYHGERFVVTQGDQSGQLTAEQMTALQAKLNVPAGQEWARQILSTVATMAIAVGWTTVLRMEMCRIP